MSLSQVVGFDPAQELDEASGAWVRSVDWHRDCFACGIGSPAGLGLHFAVGKDGVARAEWNPAERFASYPDRIHGGVIATLVDSAIVHALFAQGVAGVTVELSLRYLRKVALAGAVAISGWVESGKHGLFICRAEVKQSGELCLRARGKFMNCPEFTLPSSFSRT